jgi:hypothetical protein
MALEMKRIKLAELAFACDTYARISGYDKSYFEFLHATKPAIDFEQEQHVLALIKWLNAWGCRQFATKHHAMAAQEITYWYRSLGKQLHATETALLSLSEAEFAVIEQAYDGLSTRPASHRRLTPERESVITIGPTGAAKILFALRPHAFIPWDTFMRNRYHLDGSGRSYCVYLQGVREQLRALDSECAEHGLALHDLPRAVGRPQSSLTKLIDEFHWVTISRKGVSPSENELRRWAAWL